VDLSLLMEEPMSRPTPTRLMLKELKRKAKRKELKKRATFEDNIMKKVYKIERGQLR
jgi:hypothetical protein